MQNKQLSQEELESFKKAYTICSNEELSIIFNLTKEQIKSISRVFGLKKNEQIKRAYMRSVALKNLEKANTDNCANKRKDRIRRMVARERLRIKYGLPQRTKKILTALTPYEILQAARRRYYLRSKGYVITDSKTKVVFYTTETKRSSKIEQHFTEFGYTFKHI